MIRHIIWDWNGTLLDDADACVAAINVLLRRRRLPELNRAQYTNVFDFPVKNYYLRLGFDFTRDDWDRVAVEYHEVYAVTAAEAPLRAGAAAVLAALRERGLGQSILSACEQSLLEAMVGARGIRPCFARLYGLADQYARSKLELGRTLLADAALRADETVVVGDTTHDYDVARALGCACLLMTGGHQDEARLRACPCPVVHRLEDVPAAIDELSKKEQPP